MNDFPLILSIKGKDSNFITSIQHYNVMVVTLAISATWEKEIKGI